jgi:hypothetical protein
MEVMVKEVNRYKNGLLIFMMQELQPQQALKT